jgi:transforming growth factor-beta-induced protein
MKPSIRSLALLVGVLALGACDDENDMMGPESSPITEANSDQAGPSEGDMPITLLALNSPDLSQLVAALSYADLPAEQMGQDAGLVDLFLNGSDPFTVFAPTDLAFESLYLFLSDLLGTRIDEITDIPSDIVLDVLRYHVTPGRRGASSVLPNAGDREINTLLEEDFYVRSDGHIEDGLSDLRFENRADAEIMEVDISASNGIIHKISEVIVPPSVVAALTAEIT